MFVSKINFEPKKNLGSQKFFAPQKFLIQKKLGPKKFVPKNFWSKKMFCPQKVRDPKNVRTKKICPIIKDNKNKGPKKMWSTKIKLPKLIPKIFVKSGQ